MTPYTLERSLTQAEFNLFAEVSGDNNPIHVDPDFSARTRFGRTVSHGMLLYSVLWGLIQARHPGAKQKHQNLMFPAPAYADEPLRFEVMPLGGNRFNVKVSRVIDGTVVCNGDAAIEGV
jgi:acyl dehydratase